MRVFPSRDGGVKVGSCEVSLISFLLFVSAIDQPA